MNLINIHPRNSKLHLKYMHWWDICDKYATEGLCNVIYRDLQLRRYKKRMHSALAVSLGLVLPNADNDVSGILGLARQVVLEDLLCAVRVAGLGVERGTRVVRHHSVSTAERVLDRTPDVVLGRGLHVPDVAGVAGELAARKRGGDVVLVADGTAGGVDEPRALLKVLQELGVDEAARPLVQRAVDGDDVALRHEVLEVVDAARLDGFGSGGREGCVVVVEKLFAVEGQETLKDTVTDAASSNGADNFALQVECVPCNVGDNPVTALDHLVRRHKVPHKQEDAHDDVLGNGDDVGSRDLENLDSVVNSGIEVDVVRSDTCGDADLEVLGLLHEFAGQVARVEGSGDENFSIGEVLLEFAVGAFFAAGNNKFMTLGFEPFLDSKLVLDGTEEARLLFSSNTTVVEDSEDLHDDL